MQSNDTDARTQRRLQRAERQRELEEQTRQRERELAQQNRRKDNQRLALQPLGMLQAREQSIGRIKPFTGLTRRPHTGWVKPQTWTVLFTQMLRSMLTGSLTPEQLARVSITTENTHDRDEVNIHDEVQYRTFNSQPVGATKGRLSITVDQGAPREGCSFFGSWYPHLMHENPLDLRERLTQEYSDFRATRCRSERTARIMLSPFREITHRIVPVDPRRETYRFKDFQSWEHGVAFVRDEQRYKVYHCDYNTSYPVLKIVSEVIKEHYQRMDMEGPDAPWDP